MPRYIIERDMPGAGSLSADELRQASRKSAEAMADLDAVIHWQHTFVTDDKVFCVWYAESEDAIKEHGLRSGFPVTAIRQIGTVLDRGSAES
jgi:hypothetical protein